MARARPHAKRSRCWFLALLGLLGLATQPAGADEEIRVREPWIQAAPPGAAALAGYMILENLSARTRTLVDVRSPDFGAVMLHRTELRNGIARMHHEQEVQVAPRTVMTFAPGARHLMLMHPKRTLRAGDRVLLEFSFADGTRLSIPFEVQARSH